MRHAYTFILFLSNKDIFPAGLARKKKIVNLLIGDWKLDSQYSLLAPCQIGSCRKLVRGHSRAGGNPDIYPCVLRRVLLFSSRRHACPELAEGATQNRHCEKCSDVAISSISTLVF